MAYEIFITDQNTGKYFELDCDKLEMTTVFGVADLSDISKRKDTITKTLELPASPTNNKAFGTLRHWNRVTDDNIPETIGSNYSPLKQADCLVYEDGMLIIRGKLTVTEISKSKAGYITYKVVITGDAFDFVNKIRDKYLHDLDLSELNHRYNIQNIIDSWGGRITNLSNPDYPGLGLSRTERFNTDTNLFYFVPYQLGSGYVYPYIDYGVSFNGSDDLTVQDNRNQDVVNLLNFRPAVFVSEYFKRIFDAIGYTYEVRGSSEFQKKFNSLIIPNAEEKLSSTAMPEPDVFQSSGSIVRAGGGSELYYEFHERGIPLNIKTNGNYVDYAGVPYYAPSGDTHVVLRTKKSITTDARVKLRIANMHNPYSSIMFCSIQLVQRDYIKPSDSDEFNTITNWESIGETLFAVDAGITYPTTDFDFVVGERLYEQNKQLMLRIKIDNVNIGPETPFSGDYTLSNAYLSFPKDAFTPISFSAELDDVIKPKAPLNVKQVEFIKSIMHMFNLYCYSDRAKVKNVVFETYNDYYAQCSLPNLKTFAIDWTDKIDQGSENTKRPNLTIPKNYNYTFKEDGDYFNSRYKKKYSKVFGSFQFNDSLGIADEYKVELIFSPTPMVTYGGRNTSMILNIDNDFFDRSAMQPFKSNIRILSYNGLRKCNAFRIKNDVFVDGAWQNNNLLINARLYPFASNYYNNTTTGKYEDLHFSGGYEVYFNYDPSFVNAETAYRLYYMNQVSELTNPNLYLWEVNANLNQFDIHSLDLKVPVFVDDGKWGHSYFKVISCEYSSNNELAALRLQQIATYLPKSASEEGEEEVPLVTTRFGRKQTISGSADSVFEKVFINGNPASSVQVRVTDYVNGTFSGRLKVNGSEAFLGSVFTITLNSAGMGSFIASVEGTAEEDGPVLGKFTLQSPTVGVIGTPAEYQISKIY